MANVENIQAGHIVGALDSFTGVVKNTLAELKVDGMLKNLQELGAVQGETSRRPESEATLRGTRES